MKKGKIWLINHYATDMYKSRGGRHYWFAKYLIKQGYEPVIICANTYHSTEGFVDTNKDKYRIDVIEDITFVFIRTPVYGKNGIKRVLNMLSFFFNLRHISKRYASEFGKPDVILASSVHPLTLIAGIKIAKRFNIRCICEIRDLWPETLVSYGYLKKEALHTKILYFMEKKIYEKADKVIFTMRGGSDYIKDRGWDIANGGRIDLEKVYHINNGVDLIEFIHNRENETLIDSDLTNNKYFKVIYTGSIREVNNVRKIVDIAEKIWQQGYENIQFLIFGDGTERKNLEEYCSNTGLLNIKFKGYIEKKKVPFILSKSNLNILHFEQNSIKKYGASLNKLFEYLASGKPVITDCEFGYDLVKKYDCGIVLDNANAEEMANEIIKLSKKKESDYKEYGQNAYRLAKEYDFKELTNKLIKLL